MNTSRRKNPDTVADQALRALQQTFYAPKGAASVWAGRLLTEWLATRERFEVEVTGDPDVKVTFKGLQPASIEEGLVRNPGVVVTANHCVSAIPYVVAAAPGIATYLDLPLVAGRAAPHLGHQR